MALCLIVSSLALAPLAAAFSPWTLNVPDLLSSDTSSLFQASAVTLQNGTVLVAGGKKKSGQVLPPKETQLYDPQANEWRLGPRMTYGRTGGFGMVTLADGRVMAAGGTVYLNDGSGYTSDKLAATVEILDPTTGVWEPTAEMTVPRQAVILAALPDGSAVAIGGTNRGDSYGDGLKTAERWDPSTQVWTAIGQQVTRGLNGGQAVTLTNGSVLVYGKYSQLTFIYDPATQTFKGGNAQMSITRGSSFGLAALHNGSIIAAGGYSGSSNLGSAEIYMPTENKWVQIHDMNYVRAGATATTLKNSSVLVIGASDSSAWSQTAELWDSSAWRCFSNTSLPAADGGSCGMLTCQRTTDGSGIDLKSCQEACGPPPLKICQGLNTCQNGGTCVIEPPDLPQTVAGGGGSRRRRQLQNDPKNPGSCALQDMTQRTAEVNAQCCGSDDGTCSGGIPTTCDAGCAAVFIPFWDQCGAAFANGGVDFLGVLALCEERKRGYMCACAQGWDGIDCEHSTAPPKAPTKTCGACLPCNACGACRDCTVCNRYCTHLYGSAYCHGYACAGRRRLSSNSTTNSTSQAKV